MMSDFDRWMSRQTPAKVKPVLPSNVDEMKDGSFMAGCFVCGNWCKIDPAWLDGLSSGDDFIYWCGKDERCCP